MNPAVAFIHDRLSEVITEDSTAVAPNDAAALAEFASNLNAETMAAMRTRHRVEIGEVWKKLRKETERCSHYDDILTRSVVTLTNGDSVTLHQLFEDAHTETFSMTRKLCETCRDPKCAFPEDHQ